MNLKIGDLVILNNEGFAFHGNPEVQFDTHTVGKSGVVAEDVFKEAFVEVLALQGVGRVIKFNQDEPFIKFEHRTKGMYFTYNHYFEPDSIDKLSLFQKLKYKLLGRL